MCHIIFALKDVLFEITKYLSLIQKYRLSLINKKCYHLIKNEYHHVKEYILKLIPIFEKISHAYKYNTKKYIISCNKTELLFFYNIFIPFVYSTKFEYEKLGLDMDFLAILHLYTTYCIPTIKIVPHNIITKCIQNKAKWIIIMYISYIIPYKNNLKYLSSDIRKYDLFCKDLYGGHLLILWNKYTMEYTLKYIDPLFKREHDDILELLGIRSINGSISNSSNSNNSNNGNKTNKYNDINESIVTKDIFIVLNYLLKIIEKDDINYKLCKEALSFI